MNVLWPWYLTLLLLIPLLIAGYIWMLRRKRKFTVRYSSLSLIRAAQPEVPVFVYAADHGFNCDERESYDATAAAEAELRTFEFFAAELK